MRISGRVDFNPSMLTLFSPRLRSWALSVAVPTLVSLRLSSALRPFGARPAASGEPQASTRSGSVVLGPLPKSAISMVPWVTVVLKRPVDSPASGASTSTSMTSPGPATEDPAGVPVRITSPGSSVMSWDRSATIWLKEKINPAVVSS